jgi:hypothetical protein
MNKGISQLLEGHTHSPVLKVRTTGNRIEGTDQAQPCPGKRSWSWTGRGTGTHAEYVLVRLVGRGLGRSRGEIPPRSQTLLPSLWKGKVGQTGDLGEWRGGTTGGDVGSDVMVGPAGEPGGLWGTGAGEGLGCPCEQDPAWPCSAASPATGSVCKGEREKHSQVQPGHKSGGLFLSATAAAWPLPDAVSSPERQNSHTEAGEELRGRARLTCVKAWVPSPASR